MDPGTQQTLTEFGRITTIICLAIMMSVPIYVVVGWFVTGQGTSLTDLPMLVIFMLSATAAGLLIGAGVISDRLKAAAAIKPTLPERLAGHRTATIIAFAMREGIAIIGLAITLINGDMRWCLVFGALALISMLQGWPKRAELSRLASDIPPAFN